MRAGGVCFSGPLEICIADLASFSSDETSISPVPTALSAGDATVFAPSLILHRGRPPWRRRSRTLSSSISSRFEPLGSQKWTHVLAPRLFAGRSTLCGTIPIRETSHPSSATMKLPHRYGRSLVYPFPLR